MKGGITVNGARAVARTLRDSGVEVCFANPGTSELHFVAALDDEPALRAVPCLFEGVDCGSVEHVVRHRGSPPGFFDTSSVPRNGERPHGLPGGGPWGLSALRNPPTGPPHGASRGRAQPSATSAVRSRRRLV
ncbi:thiamine pyrophosphate-binding protein [Streptomyces hokutonensis]|uniref:thiamine pyrophosphate-binding protein n=1 Tax=Streptomyces hokutonensis TaxID=1306990 RepID=UPI0036C2C3ED